MQPISKSAVSNLIMVLSEKHKLIERSAMRMRTTWGFEERCILSGIKPAMINRDGQILGVVRKINIVAVPISCHDPLNLMMKVVRPNGVKPFPTLVCRSYNGYKIPVV